MRWLTALVGCLLLAALLTIPFTPDRADAAFNVIVNSISRPQGPSSIPEGETRQYTASFRAIAMSPEGGFRGADVYDDDGWFRWRDDYLAVGTADLPAGAAGTTRTGTIKFALRCKNGRILGANVIDGIDTGSSGEGTAEVYVRLTDFLGSRRRSSYKKVSCS